MDVSPKLAPILETLGFREPFDGAIVGAVQRRIVIFDGLCNLCSGGARWLQHHQGEPPFHMATGASPSLTHGYISSLPQDEGGDWFTRRE